MAVPRFKLAAGPPMAGARVIAAAGRRQALGWGAIGIAMAAVMLALPLLLFALLSKLKLGFWIWSYYVPYEELWQALASGTRARSTARRCSR